MAVSYPMAFRQNATLWKVRQGMFIRSLRVAMGLTQEELAAAVDLRNRGDISQIETGKMFVPPERIKSFCDALKQDPQEFGLRILADSNRWLYETITGLPAEGNDQLARPSERVGTYNSPPRPHPHDGGYNKGSPNGRLQEE